MASARIAAQLHPFLEDRTLTEVQLQQISMYIDLLLRWNSRINLTAIRDPEEIVTRHFGESLFLAYHLFPDAGVARANVERAPSPAWLSNPPHSSSLETQLPLPSPDTSRLDYDLAGGGTRPAFKKAIRVLDIGSGAGFPGLPIKIWAPDISLTLAESNHKKAAFLREVIRALTLTNVNVLTARAETLVDTHPPSDVVTLRAVERFETILPIAARLVASTGRLAVLIGSSQLSELASLTPKLTWNAPSPVPQSDSRVLSISVPH